MSDDQVLRLILKELKEHTRLLQELSTAVDGVERAVYDSAPPS